jgi:hypothetical protein
MNTTQAPGAAVLEMAEFLNTIPPSIWDETRREIAVMFAQRIVRKYLRGKYVHNHKGRRVRTWK